MSRNVSIVLGLGYGDEGKGNVTAALCLKNPDSLVVRFGGGHQCAHTVVREDGLSHVFSNFGSGTMYNVPTYWSEYCTFDPVGIKNEYEELKKKGITPKLFIDWSAKCVTPFDIEFNKYDEKTLLNGSCGVGFGATVKRNENNYKLFAIDLYSNSVINTKLELIKEYYQSNLDTKEFLEAVNWLKECPDIKVEPNIYMAHHNIIFEGHQGFYLDQKYGYFPHVTHSNTHVGNALELMNRRYLMNPEFFFVTRAYQTRHGNGPMSNEDKPVELINTDTETNKARPIQGPFRTGILDIDEVRYAMLCNFYLKRSSAANVVMTCVDQINGPLQYTEKGEVKTVELDEERISKLLFNANTIFSRSPCSDKLYDEL